MYGPIGDSVFGRSPVLRCPHYEAEAGRCSIWQYRNAVCMTWFCRFVRGPVGHHFWTQTKELFRTVESQLAVLCAQALLDDIEQLTAVMGEGRTPLSERLVDELVGPSSDRYCALWGSWLGKEEHFFVRCAQLVGTMSWADVLRACGPEVVARARCVLAAFEALAGKLPQRVRVAPGVHEAYALAGATLAVQGSTDTLSVPSDVMSRVREIDECDVQDLARESANRPALDAAWIQALLDYGLLVRAD